MMKRAAFFLLAVGLLSTTSGCGVFQALIYNPFGDGGPVLRRGCCCEGPCGPACGPCSAACGQTCGACQAPCGPACGPCSAACGPTCRVCQAPCGPACGPCSAACGPTCGACQAPCGPACGPCNGVVCGPHRACCDCECGNGGGPHPLRWLCGLFDWNCDCGCGEKYWGDWSDPPDCHDPCNRCGHFVGRGCCGGGCGPDPGYPPGTVVYGPPMDDSAANRSPQAAPQPDRAVAQGDPSASAVRVASRPQYNLSSYGPPQRPAYSSNPNPYQGQNPYPYQSRGQYQGQTQYQSQGQYQGQNQNQ
jgi:hypothetical protein